MRLNFMAGQAMHTYQCSRHRLSKSVYKIKILLKKSRESHDADVNLA